jgi:hypothetical protein
MQKGVHMGSPHPVLEDVCLFFGEYSGNASVIILVALLCNGHYGGIMHNLENCSNVIMMFHFSENSDHMTPSTPFMTPIL